MNKAANLTGDRCQCAVCGYVFASTAAFDKHRTGQHGKDRRCRSADEMIAAGMAERPRGWVTEAREWGAWVAGGDELAHRGRGVATSLP